MNYRDLYNFRNEIKNIEKFPTSRLKLLLSYIKLFKDSNIILTNKELEIQKEYRKILISELIVRGKRKDL